jgi:hypothetical protein
MSYFQRAPEFVGNAADVSLVTQVRMLFFFFWIAQPQFCRTICNHKFIFFLFVQNGIQYASVNGSLREVVVATLNDVTAFGNGLSEGVYLVGTGSTGAPGEPKYIFLDIFFF